MRIRPYAASDRERLLRICVAAFAPIHRGFEEALGSEIFRRRFDGWEEQYDKTFRAIDPLDPSVQVHVVEEAGIPVAFVFTILDAARRIGEIGLNAVDPARQGQGIGRMMHEFALAELKARGAEVAYVGTGGDAAHAPARAAYAAVGFDKAVPSVHLFKKL